MGHTPPLGTWLIALPARATSSVASLLPLAVGQFTLRWHEFPMGPMQGDVYAWNVLSLRPGTEYPFHGGVEQGQDAAADLLLGLLAMLPSWPRGFPLGSVLQVSDTERTPHAPVALQTFLVSVCYSSGSG